MLCHSRAQVAAERRDILFRAAEWGILVRRLFTIALNVFVVLALAPAGFAFAAGDRLEMRFSCEVKDGKLQLTRSAQPRSYPIIGSRRQRNYTACKDAAGRDCKSMTIHQFDMSCGGSRVAWFKVAAGMRGGELGPSRVEDGRLHFVVAAPRDRAADGSGAPGELRYARFILPPGFAPVAEVGSRLQVGGVASTIEAMNAPSNDGEATALPVAVNIPVPVAKPTLAERSLDGIADGRASDSGRTDIPKTRVEETRLAQGWSASVAPPPDETGTIGSQSAGLGLPSGWFMAIVGFLAVTSGLAGAGFVFWRRGGLLQSGGVSESGAPVAETADAVAPAIAVAPQPAGPRIGSWSARGGEAFANLKVKAGSAAKVSSSVLGVAAGRSLAAMAAAVATAGAATGAAGSGLASIARAGAGAVRSAARARTREPNAAKPVGGMSLRERLERVGQAFGETVVPAKTSPLQSSAAAQRRGPVPSADALPGHSGHTPHQSQVPLPGRMDASNVASGLKSVEALFEQVAEVVGDVKPESPLRETLEFELRNIAHRISVFVGTGEQPPTGPRAAATLRGAVRDLERVRRIADSAAASFSSGLHSERLSRLPQSKGEAYQVLGVNADVSETTLKKIVDALRMSWHPDLAKDEADRVEREDRIKQINIAWEIINDKRAA